jgi:hypothetical protein
MPAAPLVVRCRYLIVVPRQLPAAALVLHRRAVFIYYVARLMLVAALVMHRKAVFVYHDAHAVAMRRRSKCVEGTRCARPLPAAPLVVFRRYLIVVPRSLPQRRDAVAAGEEQLC